MRLILSLIFTCLLTSGFSQIIALIPQGVGPEQEATLVFDASEGNRELLNVSKVYIHHGVVTNSPTSTAWQYVKGNWGKDDGIGEMTRVPGEQNKWQISFTPSIRKYFGVPDGTNIYRIACVFRNANGSIKGTTQPGNYGWGTVASNLDFFIDLNVEDFIQISEPVGNDAYLEPGTSINIRANASSDVSQMTLFLDEGNGYEEFASVSSGKVLNYYYTPSKSTFLKIKFTAKINDKDYEALKDFNIVVRKPTVEEPRPIGMKQGVNYHEGDHTKATFVFLAPMKKFVYLVGDFNDWRASDNYQMKKDGEFFWLEINNLQPGRKYAYQYWIDGELKLADPYAELIADPWNDKWISAEVFSDLPDYDKTEYGLAAVFETAQTPYEWALSEQNWQRPDVNHLVIYELHLRDFLRNNTFKTLTDTISYLKSLGINAIELMPINEFEGNDSWGYNPSFYFAVDKYYGHKNDLKRFVEACHQHDIAVILDMVLNHSFGQSPMVQMYFNKSTNKPTPDNPWFNVNHVGPFEWGYDFNHESSYTQDFVDHVNEFWIKEFHIDGYRFDFTKGFTQRAPGGSLDNFDQSRIDIIKRMADRLREVDPEVYVILEHWGPASEESVLASYGMKLWRNKSYDFVPATVGSFAGNLSGTDVLTHVTFYNSHDERRIAEHCLTEGRSLGNYNIRQKEVMYERVKLAAAFCYLQPGPKMIWQFDELGYDIDINFNGRTGRKPYPWGNRSGDLGYYEDPLRQHIYRVYKELIQIRNTVKPEVLHSATKRHSLSGWAKRLSFDTPDIDLVVLGNFGLDTRTVSGGFTEQGTWYEYFSGDSISVTNPDINISLKAGEWRVYTNRKLSDGIPGAVEIYDNPVTITPMPFTKSDEITIRFDAKRASKAGTNGLTGADKVYMHAGLTFDNFTNTNLTKVVGTLQDDGIGEMTKVGDELWEIKLIAKEYFQLDNNEDPYRLGMYFRDAANENFGFGFRGAVIFADFESEDPFVEIEPPAFSADTPIKITFNARKGNKELSGASKVYLHSSVGITNTDSPQNNAWNKVVGNWGMDDGVGRMTRSSTHPDKWSITLTPAQYYQLAPGEHPYWLAAVFRNETGTLKGTGNPGPLENGFIHTNQDFFIKNQFIVSTQDNADKFALNIYPNPTNGILYINASQPSDMEIFDISGRRVFKATTKDNAAVDLSNLNAGVYLYQLINAHSRSTGKLIITK